MPSPAIIGTTNRKIIVVPWIVNSALYVCGVISVLLGAPNCSRIISASVPPIRKKTNVVTMYMIPMRLWSVVVTHEVQPRGARSTERTAICGTATAGAVSVVAAKAFQRVVGEGVTPPYCLRCC